MGYHTIEDAARLSGVSRSTIYRRIKSGEMSVEISPDGKKRIETSELSRVFGDLPGKPENSTETHHEKIKDASCDKIVELLERQLTHMERELSDAKERESRLLALLETQTRLIDRPALEIKPGAEGQGDVGEARQGVKASSQRTEGEAPGKGA